MTASIQRHIYEAGESFKGFVAQTCLNCEHTMNSVLSRYWCPKCNAMNLRLDADLHEHPAQGETADVIRVGQLSTRIAVQGTGVKWSHLFKQLYIPIVTIPPKDHPQLYGKNVWLYESEKRFDPAWYHIVIVSDSHNVTIVKNRFGRVDEQYALYEIEMILPRWVGEPHINLLKGN